MDELKPPQKKLADALDQTRNIDANSEIVPGTRKTMPPHSAVYVGNVRRNLDSELGVVVTHVDEDKVNVKFDRYIGGYEIGHIKREDWETL